MSNLQSTYF